MGITFLSIPLQETRLKPFASCRWLIPLPVLFLMTASLPARADVSGEAILKALVKKGILTQEEADALRREAEAEPAPPPAAPASDDTRKAQAEMADQISSIQSTLTRVQRTSVTGYVQARAVFQKNATPYSNFFVRRARLNLRHTTDFGRFAFSLDGGQNTVTVKDAYFDWFISPSNGQKQGWMLRSGQFFRPFGFEVERGATDREFPERPAGWAVLFPGNRDQGFDLSVGLTPATLFNVAILNGNGTSTAALPFRDVDNHKDLIARIRHSVFSPRMDFALSGYWGKQTAAGAAAVPAQLGFVDANGNGKKDAGETTVIITPAKAAVPEIEGDRTRWSFAANVYAVAGGTFRGEWVGARDLTTNLGTGPARGTAQAKAWYALYTHPVGEATTVGVRYDVFDPDTRNRLRLGGDGEIKTWGLVGLRQIGENIRLTLAWERPRVTFYDKAAQASSSQDNDTYTFQGQYRF